MILHVILLPGVPTFMISNRDHNSITVQWDIIDGNHNFCDCYDTKPFYMLMISSNQDTNVMDSVNVFNQNEDEDEDEDTLFHTFNNLRSNTAYNITISAVSRAGAGMTNTISAATTEGMLYATGCVEL